MTPAHLVGHNTLVARAKKHTGRILQITTGWCAYRRGWGAFATSYPVLGT